MSYTYDSNGALSFVSAYVRPMNNAFPTVSNNNNIADPISPLSLYVHSNNKIDNGHLASWTSTPKMHNRNGSQVTNFSAENGHEYAIHAVQNNTDDKVAGVIIETAAEPGQTTYINKNAIHTSHQVTNNNQYIHRMATSGSIVLAWVSLSDHQNSLSGMYDEYHNGVLQGKAIVRKIDSNYFSISSISTNDSLASRVENLEARLDSLTL